MSPQRKIKPSAKKEPPAKDEPLVTESEPPQWVYEGSFIQILDSLLEEQRVFVLHVLERLGNKDMPFYYFLSGSAGTGKSYVVQAIVKLVNILFENSSGASHVLVMAPTEKTASIINGTTLHESLAIPVSMLVEEPPELPELSAHTAKLLFSKLESIKLIIIDEISSIGKLFISHVNARLKQIFGLSIDFANLPVILSGDFRQVPPKFDAPIFQNKPIWDQFQFYELQTIIRQKDDQHFCRILNNFSTGELTTEDLALLNARNFVQTQEPDMACPMSLYLYCDNKAVHYFNTLLLNSSDSDTRSIISIAADSISGPGHRKDIETLLRHYQQKPLPDVKGLPFKLTLKESAHYMISHNIDASAGLVTGAIGVLKGFTMVNGNVDIVYLEFEDSNIGTGRRADGHGFDEKCVRISRVSATLHNNFVHNLTFARSQFPLVPADAVQVNNVRGRTFGDVCISLNENEQMTGNLLYMALSRVRSLDNLHFIGCVTEAHSIKDEEFSKELSRLRHQAKLNLSSQHTSGQFTVCYYDFDDVNQLPINPLLTKYLGSDHHILEHDIIFIKAHNFSGEDYPPVQKRCSDLKLSLLFGITKVSPNLFVYTKTPPYIVKRHEVEGALILLKVKHLYILSGYFLPQTKGTNKRRVLRRMLDEVPQGSQLIVIGNLKFGGYEFRKIKFSHKLELVFLSETATPSLNSVPNIIYTNLGNYKTQTHAALFSCHSAICIQVPTVCVNEPQNLTQTTPTHNDECHQKNMTHPTDTFSTRKETASSDPVCESSNHPEPSRPSKNLESELNIRNSPNEKSSKKRKSSHPIRMSDDECVFPI